MARKVFVAFVALLVLASARPACAQMLEMNGVIRMYLGAGLGFGLGAIAGFAWQGDPNSEDYDGDKVEAAVLAGTAVGVAAGLVWAVATRWNSYSNAPPPPAVIIGATAVSGGGLFALPALAITVAADEDATTVLNWTLGSMLVGTGVGLLVGLHHVAHRGSRPTGTALLVANADGQVGLGVPLPVVRRLPDQTVRVGTRLLAFSF